MVKIKRDNRTGTSFRDFIPKESNNQFSVLEKTFFPGRFDDTGVRKPATVTGNKEKSETPLTK